MSGSRSSVRVVVIDDHGLFARGLELVLGAATEGLVEVVASTTDPFAAEALVAEHAPNIAIVDLSMPARTGEEVVAALKISAPELRMLVLSGTDDPARIHEALALGADGFIPKTSDPAELLGPILSVAAGWSVLPPTTLSALLQTPQPLPVSISRRDLWLLRRVAAGAEVRELRDELHVSERTVKRILADLLDRLGVESRIEAVALAGRSGLLEEPAERQPPGP